jgi:hypothetical protein
MANIRLEEQHQLSVGYGTAVAADGEYNIAIDVLLTEVRLTTPESRQSERS